MIPERLKRFFRKTIAYPTGAIVHDGDCSFFSYAICDCGLLHELRFHPETASILYPNFYKEESTHQWQLQKSIEED